MDGNNDKIISNQLFSVLTSLIIGIGILSLPRNLADKAGADSLVVLIIGSLIFMLIANLIVTLVLKFPHSTIIEIGNYLMGKFVGKILGIAYFIYIFMLAVIEARVVGEICKSFLLLTTPIEIIILSFLLVSAYTVRSGMETIARMAVILLPPSIIPALLAMFIVLPDIDPTYFLPVLRTPPINLLKSIPEVGFSFLGFEFILFIAFFVKDYKNIRKVSNISIITVSIIYFLTVFITIGRFGIEETRTLVWPVITLFKTINIPGTFLENIEVIIMTTWLFSIFMTFTISYYGAVFLLSRVIESKEHNYLAIPLLPLIYFCSLIPENVAQTYDLLGKYSYIGGTIFIVGIPILLLVMSIFKRKPKKEIKRNG
ncbi:spore germination protein [Caminicella sporogenes DSM 14501]|uniref:Spore germination protein n=1 Tax=Caminicella sporogenes DSM 14501 TaxID=1121266 RepID=A0A1M6PNT9_9FIRM|nr:endospore germination permease [Caminicella sporogenes]RKD22033.1 hypothetical protein BET04_07225 [Caminicella sporogenes]SHK09612.1 spore germination protein [Caminicella sporogenes DSM 14501]